LFIDTAHPLLKSELSDFGFQCDYFEDYQRKDFLRIIPEYQGVIIRGKLKLDKEFLDTAKKLEFIGRVGAGMENIDINHAESLGIVCLNAPEGNRDAVGEHTLGMLLMLMNRLKIADHEVREGIWIREGNRGTEICGKTIGIIGYGNMGSAFAQRLKGFDARVIAYDKYKFKYSDKYVEESDMETIFRECDILSLHVPLTHETEYLMDDYYLNSFKKNIYLINTARGKVLKTSALVSTMKSGKVIGACLDVLEYEKMTFEDINKDELPDDFRYLINSDRVVLSPHIAGWTHESSYKLARVIVDKVKKIYN